jgi:hypothetical protein
MIANVTQLNEALRQLSSFADMLEALRLDAENKNDWSLFPLLSKGYLARIRDLNTEIKDYIQQPDTSHDTRFQTVKASG